MYDDVVDLRDFYRTSLGQAAARSLRRRMRELWPGLRGQRLLGLGYPGPFLQPFLEECERVALCMPAPQGVLRWPQDQPNRAALVDERRLPFADASFDRLVMVHTLERTEQIRPLLREAWRVLTGGGRLLVVVPNRRGVWARIDRTPFGHGSPFSPDQLSRLLRDTLFTPAVSVQALFWPPSKNRMVLTAAPMWERFGARWTPQFGGVILMEAGKQLYASPGLRAPAEARPMFLPASAQPQAFGRRREGDDPQ